MQSTPTGDLAHAVKQEANIFVIDSSDSRRKFAFAFQEIFKKIVTGRHWIQRSRRLLFALLPRIKFIMCQTPYKRQTDKHTQGRPSYGERGARLHRNLSGGGGKPGINQ